MSEFELNRNITWYLDSNINLNCPTSQNPIRLIQFDRRILELIGKTKNNNLNINEEIFLNENKFITKEKIPNQSIGIPINVEGNVENFIQDDYCAIFNNFIDHETTQSIKRWLELISYDQLDFDSHNNSHIRHWHKHLCLRNVSDAFQHINLLKSISDVVRDFYKCSSANPVFMTAYATVYGDIAHFHRDLVGRLGITAVLFCNETWSDSHGGELVICDSNDEPYRAVAVRPGRLVLFKSSALHRAGVPNRSCTDVRRALVFRYILDQNH